MKSPLLDGVWIMESSTGLEETPVSYGIILYFF